MGEGRGGWPGRAGGGQCRVGVVRTQGGTTVFRSSVSWPLARVSRDV